MNSATSHPWLAWHHKAIKKMRRIDALDCFHDFHDFHDLFVWLYMIVVTYHPRLKALSKIIHENVNILYMNDEVKDTFTPKPKVSFRTSRKLSSYLVRAKLYPLERPVGSRKCSNKRCGFFENVQNSDTFRSSVTSETFIIKRWLVMINA